jgi:hypothetical protein
VDKFVSQAHNELTFHARLDFESPQFRVFVAGEGDISPHKLFNHLLVTMKLLFNSTTDE